MLGNYPIDVVLKARDLAAAKDFYADTLGLRVLSDKKLRTERPSSHQGSELLVQDRRRQTHVLSCSYPKRSIGSVEVGITSDRIA